MFHNTVNFFEKGGEPMKTLYVCDICGLQSYDDQVIKDCEEQGNDHVYPVGTAIEFKPARAKGEWIPGTIHEVEFGRGDHMPLYIIRVSEQTAKQLGITQTLIRPFFEGGEMRLSPEYV